MCVLDDIDHGLVGNHLLVVPLVPVKRHVLYEPEAEDVYTVCLQSLFHAVIFCLKMGKTSWTYSRFFLEGVLESGASTRQKRFKEV